MGKHKDLSDFDKCQIVMARRLGQSISKTAGLVGCSRYAVVSTYKKWSKEGQPVNRRQAFSFRSCGRLGACVLFTCGRDGRRIHHKKRQAGGGSVMLWAILYPGIRVDVTLTLTTFLRIVADHVHPFMATVFPDVSGLFQQDNMPCHTAQIVQKWFEEHDNEFKVLTCLPISQISIQLSIYRMCWTNKSEIFRI